MKRSTIRPKNYLSVLFVIFFVTICLAATYLTANNGIWSNNATWRSIPASGENHTVNLNISKVNATIIS